MHTNGTGRNKAAAERPALAVDAKGVSLTFETSDGQVEALSKIDLQIAAGEFVSFIGPSGCGKTTLLRVIADLEQPSAGTIAINGVTPDEARLGRHYGYIFQAPALYPWRTIERNVMLPLEIMGVPAAERKARARYLALVNLSGFERNFLAIVRRHAAARLDRPRALLRPALLLMDERSVRSTIVRDHLNEQLLRLWNQTGKTVVFVTHRSPRRCSCRPRSW